MSVRRIVICFNTIVYASSRLWGMIFAGLILIIILGIANASALVASASHIVGYDSTQGAFWHNTNIHTDISERICVISSPVNQHITAGTFRSTVRDKLLRLNNAGTQNPSNWDGLAAGRISMDLPLFGGTVSPTASEPVQCNQLTQTERNAVPIEIYLAHDVTRVDNGFGQSPCTSFAGNQACTRNTIPIYNATVNHTDLAYSYVWFPEAALYTSTHAEVANPQWVISHEFGHVLGLNDGNGDNCLGSVMHAGKGECGIDPSILWPSRADRVSVLNIAGAMYVPDLVNSNGWISEFYIRNDGTRSRSVTTYYFDGNGNPTPKGSDICVLNPSQWCKISVDQLNRIPSGTTGSAVVDGGQEVTVEVQTLKNSRTEITNYTGILTVNNIPNHGLEVVGPTLYAPAIKRQYSGRSSAIVVTNAGSIDTTVSVVFYNASGAARTVGTFALRPNAKRTIYAFEGGGSGGCDAPGVICSAKLASNNSQPLAGVVQEYRDTDGLALATDNLASVGNSSIYFPVVKHHYASTTTGLQVQNVGTAGTTVTATYYQPGGSQQCARSAVVPSNASTLFYDFDNTCPGSNFLGSVVATASQPLVGRANEASDDGRLKKAYTAFGVGSHTAYGPLVYGAWVSGPTWDSPIVVQNLSASTATNVTLTYYNSGGSVATLQSGVLNPRGSSVFLVPLTNFSGSVKITADQDIVAVINVKSSDTSGDNHATYNANNR